MIKRLVILFAINLILLTGCGATATPALRGRILLWHDWQEQETAVLEEMLSGFSALNPEVRVISVAVPPGTLRQRYEETATLGLGPDLLLLSDMDVRPLANANLIRSLPDGAINGDKFLSTALDSLRYQNAIYGLPLSLRPVALYYDTERVADPPLTLEALLQEARAGQPVALNTQFLHSLWGLPAFGGSIFDADGRVVLNQGGYTNWLNWLKTAQETPGMILERSDETLRNLFVLGRVAYYVGSPEALPDLQERMDTARVRAAVLPAGPNGPAGPLLHVEAILFNQASSNHQAELALALANFLTNAEQNARLMREADRVPANRRVRVDQQAFPVMASFAAQARTAVAVPQQPQMETLIAAGDEMLRGLLTGIVEVNEAADQLAQTVNEQYGLATVPAVSVITDCDVAGSLTVWHTWRGAAATALEQIAADFMTRCRDTSVQLRQYVPDDLLALLEADTADEAGPDLIVGPSDWTLRLATAGSVVQLDDRVNADLLQQFVPAALNTLRADGQLYGLPVNLNLSGLYYNGDAVTDPATTLDDLLNEAASGRKVAIPVTFSDAFWGVAAFGGTFFDDSYRLALVDSGFVGWLGWLQEAQRDSGIILSVDDAILRVLFSSGAVAYYAGSSRQLEFLQSTLGAETVRVAELPAGPDGAAAPRLSTDALFFNRESVQLRGELALAFALFVTAFDAQTALMTQAQLVPANVNVDSSSFPAITGFIMQAQTAVIWPQVPQLSAVEQFGDQVYESIVLRQLPPVRVACNFETSVNEANGFVIEETTLPDICVADQDAATDE